MLRNVGSPPLAVVVAEFEATHRVRIPAGRRSAALYEWGVAGLHVRDATPATIVEVMDIVLIRHGQPEWVRDGLNVVDPPLTELGRLQAERVGEILRDETFDEIIVSPLQRARQTAAPLLAAQSRAEVVEPFLAEIREPDWHGTPAELARTAYEQDRQRPAAERWNGLSGGGEPPRDFVERIRAGA